MSDDKQTPVNPGSIITMLAETHIHVGIGQSTAAIDLPVARERTTQYPFIPGSGTKGALKVWAGERTGLKNDVEELFGKGGEDTGSTDGAGTLLCSDARLLLLPVRCLSDAFKWVTCPALLRRFNRDAMRAGMAANLPDAGPDKGKYLGVSQQNGALGLEEREFAYQSGTNGNLAMLLAPLACVNENTMKEKLVVLHDKDFTWFARYALPVMARNVLSPEKKSENLWYEESLPSDTVMYMLLSERKAGAAGKITDAVNGNAAYIQMGGNETIGQGWFMMSVYGDQGGEVNNVP